MIYDVATLLELPDSDLGDEVTVRCRIQSNRIPGTSSNGLKSIYVVDDARQSIEEDVALSFWSTAPVGDPLESVISKTEEYVLDALGLPMELEEGTGRPLQRGEEVLVRAIPNRSEGNEAALYLNVTSLAIREPSRRISKGELRSQGDCPRESYLRYVKNVYTGGRHNRPPYHRRSLFQGDAVHRVVELAVAEHYDRFVDESWDEDSIAEFCYEIFEEEFGFRQALLVLSGAGLDARDYIVENVTNLFTDDEFRSRLLEADDVDVEQFLDERYGYGGRIDLLLDGTPYDIKTTRDPDEYDVERHSYQLKLYLFVLLLQSLEDGESLPAAIERGIEGALIYPNTSTGGVRLERVTLTMDDAAEFIALRNEVASGSDSFAPPSPYNRDCDGCQFAVEEWVTGEDDALPPACTYHCQNERRWPCHEVDENGFHTECSRFDDCEQRLTYRDPDEIAYFDRTRAAFQAERRSRETATQLLEQFDDDLLASAGYRVPKLEFAGIEAAGAVVRFTRTSPTIPAFESGESVQLTSDAGTVALRATYYGEDSGELLFKLDSPDAMTEILGVDESFEATYRFSTESVDRRFLPYLDFAQRRGITPGFTETMLGDDDSPSLTDAQAVGDYLDNEEVFVDVPVSPSRSQTLADMVETLVTTEYPVPDTPTETVPDAASRALVVGTTPQLVETAVAAQPDDGPHYRLDGTGGGETVIEAGDTYHEIQSRLGNARSVVSSAQMVMSQNGPGGISEFFHKLAEGDYKDADDPSKRTHSENFFDVLVILGGERLTEPEYHFLTEVADRVVTIGDTRRTGPKIISSEGLDAGLDQSYFEEAFDHYQSFPSSESVSLQISGGAPPALQLLYPEGPWEELDGEIEFLTVEGGEETALDVVELTTTVRAEHAARRLVFDVTDTPVSPIEVQEMFNDRFSLDATKLHEGTVVLIDEQSMFLDTVDDVEGENTNNHEIVIRAEAAELPQFSRALLTNSIVERIVAQAATEREIDVIVSPFENHATEIRRQLDELDIDVPVRRPEELTGDIATHALLSLPTANPEHILRPPLDDPEILYDLTSSGVNLTIVGHKETLETKDFFESLIEHANLYT